MNISAVIFDLDGTVVANEDEWGEAFRKVLKRLGVEEHSKYPHVGGIGIEENWPIFIKKFNIKTEKSIDELGAETKKEYEKLTWKIDVKKGLRKLIEELRDSGVKIGLATSSTWDSVEKIFDRLGIEDLFDCVTTGEEAKYKKPDPEIFKITAEKLGVEPEDCLVFEDSQAGIYAARSAGMKVVALYRDERHKEALKEADKLVKDFTEVTPQIIQEID